MTQHEYKPGDRVWVQAEYLHETECGDQVFYIDGLSFELASFDNIRPEPLVDIDAVVAELEEAYAGAYRNEVAFESQGQRHNGALENGRKLGLRRAIEILRRPKPKTAEDVIADCLRGTNDDAESITEALRAEGFKIVREDA
jgi:hypothetical protein